MQVYAPGEGHRETGSNKFLPERDTVERAWDPDTMIWNARSLQKVARQLASDRIPPGEDVFLFTGQQLAEPILLALSTEIALKAWQCRERQGPPDSYHDLLKLFEGLSDRAQTILEARYPEHPMPGGTHVFIPIHSGIRRILETHRDTFVRWRYVHETMSDHAYPPALDAALTAIIEAYGQSPA